MSAHTPTPWVLYVQDGECLAIMPAGREGDVCTFETGMPPSEADAAFIVKSVNAHAYLVAALNSIAHTFMENSQGGTTALPAYEYQRMAREALTKAGEL